MDELEKPSAARMYDFYLGGSYNIAADRALASEYMKAIPEIQEIARANRRFLGRAVEFLVGEGIDQFLDLGSGMPTTGNVHEIASSLNPDARVVYVDADPVTVAHGTQLLADTEQAVYLHADLREPTAILEDPRIRAHLDFGRPIGILMVAVLHFVPSDDDPGAVVQAYRAAAAPGSYLVCSHATDDYHREQMQRAGTVYNRASHSMNFRGGEDIRRLLDGWDLVAPGLVDVIRWRPDSAESDPYGGDVTRFSLLAAVGRRSTGDASG